jgi:hypothetical protein
MMSTPESPKNKNPRRIPAGVFYRDGFMLEAGEPNYFKSIIFFMSENSGVSRR